MTIDVERISYPTVEVTKFDVGEIRRILFPKAEAIKFDVKNLITFVNRTKFVQTKLFSPKWL